MHVKILYPIIGVTALGIFLCGCSAKIPKGAKAVTSFDSKKYLGKWYEIARFDYRFEKNLNNVTATYSLKDNGDIKVLNKGYDTVKKKWKSAEGKARFIKSADIARLKVSFFGPFYSGYNVIAIDEAYTYALVAGNNLAYLWILSRTPTIPESIKKEYVQKAKSIGYNTDNLIWVEHNINQ